MIAETVDLVFARLLHDWHAILDAWPILAVLFLSVLGVFGMAVRLLYRKQIADLKARLEQSDSGLAGAKAEIEGHFQALENERQARQDLESLLASLREQLAKTQGQLMVRHKPTEGPSRGSRRQSSYDELFGPGDTIDGQLTK